MHTNVWLTLVSICWKRCHDAFKTSCPFSEVARFPNAMESGKLWRDQGDARRSGQGLATGHRPIQQVSSFEAFDKLSPVASTEKRARST